MIRHFMHTYLPFASNELKRNLAYKGAFYLFIVCDLMEVFISYYLWMAIYQSSGKGTLGGLSKNEMVVYVIMVFITSTIIMQSISRTVSRDVVKGNIAMTLIKPVDYRISLISGQVGNLIYHFIVPSLFVWIFLEVYKVTVLGEPLVSPGRAALYLISICLSFLIYVLFDFCFGMVAFFTTYIFGLSMAKEVLLSFLTGRLIPISFFPEAFRKVFEYLPFESMVYSPVMIYLGKYSVRETLFVIGRQAAWVIILYLLGSFIWKKVTNRLIVLGG